MQTTTPLKAAHYTGTLLPTDTPPTDYSVVMPKLWNQKTLADYLGKSTAWCERARWAGEGPRFIKLGRHVRYRADDVLAWIEDNARPLSGTED